ncbi:hypothetical protein MNB_SV-14-1038 [hydrothermal vent metagenome]|uniref:Uncharacterized protein n=1 Tax=hydrothermal vent metagenome TaxID=652676 RepID=A0A1W1CCV1_9ZZZZ
MSLHNHKQVQKTNKDEAIKIMKENHFQRFKLDWWADFMFIFYDGKNFISGGNSIIDLKFLLDGNFIRAKDDDRLLGGLFDIA